MRTEYMYIQSKMKRGFKKHLLVSNKSKEKASVIIIDQGNGIISLWTKPGLKYQRINVDTIEEGKFLGTIYAATKEKFCPCCMCNPCDCHR